MSSLLQMNQTLVVEVDAMNQAVGATLSQMSVVKSICDSLQNKTVLFSDDCVVLTIDLSPFLTDQEIRMSTLMPNLIHPGWR